MIFRWFVPTSREASIASLYGAIVAQARAPAFYGSYGVPEDLVSSFPLRSTGSGDFQIQRDANLDDFGREKLRTTIAELEEERAVVADLLK